PSGCGKTTFLRAIAGLIDLSSGELLVGGKNVAGPPDGVAMVFQHFGLLPWKTVFANAGFGLKIAGAATAAINERVRHYLDLVGLTGFEHHYPYQLSGGMQQRVGLVRALAINPSILLMDEPFAALDAQTREILQDELLQLMQRPDERKTMVFITHSIDEAIVLGDRIAVMTARPVRIKEVLDLPFGHPSDVPSARCRVRARGSAVRGVARPYLAAIAHGAPAARHACQRGGLTMAVEARGQSIVPIARPNHHALGSTGVSPAPRERAGKTSAL